MSIERDTQARAEILADLNFTLGVYAVGEQAFAAWEALHGAVAAGLLIGFLQSDDPAGRIVFSALGLFSAVQWTFLARRTSWFSTARVRVLEQLANSLRRTVEADGARVEVFSLFPEQIAEVKRNTKFPNITAAMLRIALPAEITGIWVALVSWTLIKWWFA